MASEFASLSDLAISKGIKHSQLISDIHSRVLSVYRSRYPKSPAGVAVVVDETSGDVRLFAADKDITPPEFISQAASLARQVIIDSLAGGYSEPAASPARSVPLPS